MSEKEPLVVVIIPNWNGRSLTGSGTKGQQKYSHKSLLEYTLSTITKVQYKNIKFIMVDQESIDDSIAYVKKHYPMVEVISVPDKSYAYGINRGIIHAFKKYKDLEYIMVSNNDLIYKDPTWLKKLVAASKIDSVGIVGCKFMYADGTVCQSTSNHFRLDGLPKINRTDQPSGFSNVAVSGGGFLTKREVLEATGLEDELYIPWYWEEEDLFARARKHNYRLYYVSEAEVIHLSNQTIGNTKLKHKWTYEEFMDLYVTNGLVFTLRHTKIHVPFYLAHFLVTRPRMTINAILRIPHRIKQSRVPDVNGHYLRQYPG